MPGRNLPEEGSRPMIKSEFKKLSSYIFGSAAAIITNISLIVGMGSAEAGKGPIIGA